MRYRIDFLEGEDYRNGLNILCDDVIVGGPYWDGGEPEDNYFFRDWKWVAEELRKAYILGYTHASEQFEKSYNTSSGT